MKIALIADVHGNMPALEAVLADARAQGAEMYAFLGDYIFDMPFAADVVKRLRSMSNAVIIKGNKEKYLDDLATQDQSTWTHEQLGVIYQTYRELDADDIAWLRALPEERTVTLPSGRRLYCAHFLPKLLKEGHCIYNSSNRFCRAYEKRPFTHEEYLDGLNRFYNEELEDVIDEIDADVIAYGHNHMQGYGRRGGKLVVDAGACGLPVDMDVRPAYTLIEDCADEVRVTERRVEYDVEAAIARARGTTISRASDVWSRLTFMMMRTGCDYVVPLFEIAGRLAAERGEAGGLYENATLRAAFAELLSRISPQENVLSHDTASHGV